MMETAHQRARRERAEAKAARLRRRAESEWDASRAEVEHIPAGQPVLVGHHSERKHRRAIERATRKGHRAVETFRAAERAESAAVGAGRVVSSDDPEALEALREQLAEMERRREAFKAHNRKARKEGGEPLPAYALTNLGARIRRVKARIAELEREADRQDGEIARGDGWVLEECARDNRVRFVFDGKPGAETRKLLKGHGFRWAPSVGAWQRHRNGAARTSAQLVIAAMGGAS